MDLNKPLVKWLFLLEVIVVPIFLLILVDGLKPDWQSGQPMDILNLWLSNKVQMVFYPMIGWAVLALLALMWKFEKYKNLWSVKWGIYMGTFWCWVYFIYEILRIDTGSLLSDFRSLLIICVMVLWLTFLGWLLYRKSGKNDKRIVMGILISIVILIPFSSHLIPGSILVTALVCTPLVAAILTTALSYRLKKVDGVKAPRIWRIGFWLYVLVALAESISKLIYEYGRLPKTPPSSCFVVTAAATGHRWIVGNGDQLQNFRDFEKQWQVKQPYSHQLFRMIYNVVGPKMAKVVAKNKILADVVYVLLKPVELVVRKI